MLKVGPSSLDRPGDPVWWVRVNGTLVGSMAKHCDGGFLVVLNHHYAIRDRLRKRFPGKSPERHTLDTFDTERLARWAMANEARLERECPPPPAPPPAPDLTPEAFRLSPPAEGRSGRYNGRSEGF